MASTIAKIAKEKGNASFKTGNFAEAVGHYSAAIVADRTNLTYPLNRAAAYLKLGKHHDAERDCTTVLGLDEKNVKAFFRRAQSRIALGNLTGAEKDLMDALQLEPANESIKQEMAIFRKVKPESTKQSLGKVGREPTTVPSPLPFSQSQVGPDAAPDRHIIRNVPIEIVEGEGPLAMITPKSSTDFLKPVQSRILPSASSPAPMISPPTSSTSSTKPRVGAAIFRADGKYTIVRDPKSSLSVPSASPPPNTPTPPDQSPSNALSLPPQSPLTYFAFSRAWYALPSTHERYSLLQRIPPRSLPTLFQTSLEPAFLASILRTLSAVASPTTFSKIAEYMDAFPAIPRFATVVLLLNAEEKAVARELWNALGDGHDGGRNAWGI